VSTYDPPAPPPTWILGFCKIKILSPPAVYLWDGNGDGDGIGGL